MYLLQRDPLGLCCCYMYLVTDEARDGLYLQEVCVMHPQVQKMSVCLFVVSENKKNWYLHLLKNR